MNNNSLRTFIRLLYSIIWVFLFLAALFSTKKVANIFSRKSINVMAWTEVLDVHKIAEFEAENNIKVNVSYYDNKDELLAKLNVGSNKGYDMIIASDYVVEALLDMDLLQPLDRSRVKPFDRVHTKLLKHYYDPTNTYSLPYSWSVYGLGYDKRVFKDQPPTSWKSLFEPDKRYGKVTMIEDAREIFLLAGYYLFNSLEHLDTKISDIVHLLKRQKPFVEAYADTSAPYLLASGQSSLVASESSYIFHFMKTDENIDFVIPQEGTFVAIENVVVPKESKKTDYVYSFIDFLYRDEIMQHHVDTFSFFPSILGISFVYQSKYANILSSSKFKKFHFFRNIIPRQELQKAWVSLRTQ